MTRKALDFDQVKIFLEVVFGVVIALPLLNIPDLLINVANAYHQLGGYSSIREIWISELLIPVTSLILLSSALIFSSFYWLELIEFIGYQQKFNLAMDAYNKCSTTTTKVELVYITEWFFLGGLLMTALMATTLIFADIAKITQIDAFRQFLQANLLFWAINFVGNKILKKTYYPYSNLIKIINISCNASYQELLDWFDGHIWSPYFLFYGALSFLLILIALILDYVLKRPWGYRLIIAVLYLIYTLVGHLFLRAGFHDWWVKRREDKDSQAYKFFDRLGMIAK